MTAQIPVSYEPLTLEDIVAVDTDIGIRIVYIGTEGSGTVLVDASGDITLKHGDIGSEAFDAQIGIPSLGAIIDVSNASANTFGEVVDHINASDRWRAQLMGVRRTDSSNDSLLVFAGTPDPLQAKQIVVDCLKDTSVALTIGIKITSTLPGVGMGDGSYRHGVYRCSYLSGTATGSSLTHAARIISVDDVNGVETVLWSDVTDPDASASEFTDVLWGRGGICVSKHGDALLFHYILGGTTPAIVSPTMLVSPCRAIIGSRLDAPGYFKSER